MTKSIQVVAQSPFLIDRDHPFILLTQSWGFVQRLSGIP